MNFVIKICYKKNIKYINKIVYIKKLIVNIVIISFYYKILINIKKVVIKNHVYVKVVICKCINNNIIYIYNNVI